MGLSVVMAIIGMGIGASFLLSIMVAVPLSSLFGLQGLFWITAALGLNLSTSKAQATIVAST